MPHTPPKPQTDAQRAWDAFEERRRSGRARFERDARRENASLMSSAYENSEPRRKPEPRRSDHVDPPATRETAARRQAQANMRRGLEYDD